MRETGFQREPFELTATDGWKLRGEWLLPREPRAVAVCGHAMMVDRRTLDRPRGRGLVSRLAGRGIAVLWVDLRGHGDSGPRAADGGDWSYDDLVRDVPPLLALARQRFPSLPLAAVGHSLFAHVTLAHLTRHPGEPLSSLVLLAGNVHNPTWRKRPVSWLQKGVSIEAMRAVTRVFGYLPARRLKVGSDDEAPRYVAGFARWRRPRWDADDGYDYFAGLGRVRTPTLALVGAADRLYSPPGDVHHLMAHVPGAAVEVVGRGSGLAFDPDHMGLVLDERAAPVWERAASFVLQPR